MNNQKKILQLALYAGEIMLKNGGETYRSEDVMERICKVSGIDKVESFVTPTGIFLSIDDGNDDGLTYSFQKGIKTRQIDLRKVSAINDFSRKFSLDKMSLDDAMKTLEEIDNHRSYHPLIQTLFSGIATSAFTVASGGSVKDAICGFISGILMFLFIYYYGKIENNDFIRTLIASIIGSLFAVLCDHFGFCDNIDYIIIGSIYLLLPGIAITNAIRDSISGDLLSGLVRVFEAFIIAGSIAVGVGITLEIFGIITGGIY